ncbi:MAG: helix-turn-helix domain-containing protein [Pseudonocardiaceae bacterium]
MILLRTGQVAAILDCGINTVRRAVWRGDLRATSTPAGHLRFHPSEVQSYKESLIIVPPLRSKS